MMTVSDRKRLRQVLLAILLIGFGCSLVATAKAQIKLRVGYVVARDSHFAEGIDAFAKELERLARGRFVVEHLAAGTAGGSSNCSIKSSQASSR